jgi:hypothetical protein
MRLVGRHDRLLTNQRRSIHDPRSSHRRLGLFRFESEGNGRLHRSHAVVDLGARSRSSCQLPARFGRSRSSYQLPALFGRSRSSCQLPARLGRSHTGCDVAGGPNAIDAPSPINVRRMHDTSVGRHVRGHTGSRISWDAGPGDAGPGDGSSERPLGRHRLQRGSVSCWVPGWPVRLYGRHEGLLGGPDRGNGRIGRRDGLQNKRIRRLLLSTHRLHSGGQQDQDPRRHPLPSRAVLLFCAHDPLDSVPRLPRKGFC